MEGVAVIVLLALAGAGGYLLARRRSAAATPADDPLVPAKGPDRGDVRRLRVGDVVRHGFDDLIIRETYHLTEDGFSWQEHKADNGRWLSVEDDDTLEVAWWETIEARVEPGPEAVTVDGVTYRRREHGPRDVPLGARRGARPHRHGRVLRLRGARRAAARLRALHERR
jgi:hypothetical protein